MHGWKVEMGAVRVPFKEMCKDMQKKANQLTVTSFLTKSYVSSSAMHSVNCPDNSHPGTPTPFQ